VAADMPRLLLLLFSVVCTAARRSTAATISPRRRPTSRACGSGREATTGTIVIHQDGTYARVEFPSEKTSHEGTVTGRVLRTGGHDFVLRENGLATYTFHATHWIATLVRPCVGPSEDHPALKSNPLLHGGLVYRLPVGPDGTIDFENKQGWSVPGVPRPVLTGGTTSTSRSGAA